MPLFALKTVEYSLRWKATGVRLPTQSIIVANLCEKLKCTETDAESIYEKCPTLRLNDSIQNDSVQLLRTQLSLMSIVENPELMTMDKGKFKKPYVHHHFRTKIKRK